MSDIRNATAKYKNFRSTINREKLVRQGTRLMRDCQIGLCLMVRSDPRTI